MTALFKSLPHILTNLSLTEHSFEFELLIELMYAETVKLCYLFVSSGIDGWWKLRTLKSFTCNFHMYCC